METLDKTKLPEKNKEQLLAEQERLKTEMEYQFDGIKDDAADVGKKVLMIGGGIYLGYKLIRYLARDNKSKKKVERYADARPIVVRKEEKTGATFGTLLTQQLLTIAVLVITSQLKGKLKDYKILNE